MEMISFKVRCFAGDSLRNPFHSTIFQESTEWILSPFYRDWNKNYPEQMRLFTQTNVSSAHKKLKCPFQFWNMTKQMQPNIVYCVHHNTTKNGVPYIPSYKSTTQCFNLTSVFKLPVFRFLPCGSTQTS